MDTHRVRKSLGQAMKSLKLIHLNKIVAWGGSTFMSERAAEADWLLWLSHMGHPFGDHIRAGCLQN